MKVVLWACESANKCGARESELSSEVGLPVVRTSDPSVLRPGDFLVMGDGTGEGGALGAEMKARHRLRQVMGCDAPVAQRVREALARDVLVVGRATSDPVPPRLEAMFGTVCYVKCNGVDHSGDSRYCCTTAPLWLGRHEFYRNHGPHCRVFFPDKWEGGKRVASERPGSGVSASFSCPSMLERMPELKQATPGWLTTGMATLFSLVFEEGGAAAAPDAHVYAYRFSHWRDGRVVTPPPGMRNAFGRPPGRHDVKMERRAAELLEETGRVFPLEAAAEVAEECSKGSEGWEGRRRSTFPVRVVVEASSGSRPAPSRRRLSPVRTRGQTKAQAAALAARRKAEEEEGTGGGAEEGGSAAVAAALPKEATRALRVHEDVAVLIPDGGVCAVLGTGGGRVSRELLQRSRCGCVYSVGAWESRAEEVQARAAVADFGERSVVVRAEFGEAARGFAPEELDFVYVDGSARAFREEADGWALGARGVRDWWDLIAPGGVLSGDGYSETDSPLVRDGVDAFAKEAGCAVQVISETGEEEEEEDGRRGRRTPTWWLVKPGRPRRREGGGQGHGQGRGQGQGHGQGRERRGKATPAAVAGPTTGPSAAMCAWTKPAYVAEKRRLYKWLRGLGAPPRVMLDIGAGFAHEAEMFQREFGTELYLVEGDCAGAAAAGGARTRRSGYGPAADCAFATSRWELESSYRARGLRYTLLDPTQRSTWRKQLPPSFDLILSVGACGMLFPVAEYAGLLRKRTHARGRIVLELNPCQMREHEAAGCEVRRMLDGGRGGRQGGVCQVRMRN